VQRVTANAGNRAFIAGGVGPGRALGSGGGGGGNVSVHTMTTFSATLPGGGVGWNAPSQGAFVPAASFGGTVARIENKVGTALELQFDTLVNGAAQTDLLSMRVQGGATDETRLGSSGTFAGGSAGAFARWSLVDIQPQLALATAYTVTLTWNVVPA
jgi:hypothetical protein